MLNRYFFSGLFILCLVVSPPAFSQNLLGGKWWQNPRVVETVQLSEQQTAQLEQAFKKSRLNMITLKAKVEQEQFILETLIEDRPFDETAALEQYKKLELAKTDLGIERFKFLAQVRKIAGYEKFMALMQLKKRLSQKRTKNATPP